MKCPHCNGTGNYHPLYLSLEDCMERARETCLVLSIAIAADDTLDRAGAAALLNRKPQTLRHWAALKKGPPFTKIHERCRYRIEDIVRYSLSEERD
jgi:hypothetical protein